jgi:plasmid stabilization system protein ParE
MNFKIEWQPSAENTYFEEIDFIFLKWNFNEVEKFINIVNENLEQLSINPEIGVFKQDVQLFSIVISYQTTLLYDYNLISKKIELIVFWNNSKNPNDLAKLL